MKIDLTWTQFKAIILKKNIFLQYVQTNRFYKIWGEEGQILYVTDIFIANPVPSGSDQEDFETNYKEQGNTPLQPTDEDGKNITRAESRPIGYTTYFSSYGDSATEIGDGKSLSWDFSNDDDLISLPSGSDIKTKRIEFDFIDPVYVKEGAIYYHNAPSGTYISLHIVCPNGEWYLLNDGTPAQATEDTIINTHVNRHLLCGDCPMGDELNTETRSPQIPNTYKFCIDITVPITEDLCTGHVSIELFRKRTVILE